MSIALGYKPVKNELTHFSSVSRLHEILRKEYGMPCKLDYSCIGFLNGVMAAGFPELKSIIGAINEFGLIEVGVITE